MGKQKLCHNKRPCISKICMASLITVYSGCFVTITRTPGIIKSYSFLNDSAKASLLTSSDDKEASVSLKRLFLVVGLSLKNGTGPHVSLVKLTSALIIHTMESIVFLIPMFKTRGYLCGVYRV